MSTFAKTKTQGYRSYDSTWRDARIDMATDSLQIVDYVHHETHAGSHYMATYHADKAGTANLDMSIVTPNSTSWAHMFITVENESEMDYTLYEGATLSNNGTPVTAVNRNRNALKSASTGINHTPTVDATGTSIRIWHSGSGRGNGAISRDSSEIILKQNTKYLIRCTATAAGWIAVQCDWYEHTDIGTTSTSTSTSTSSSTTSTSSSTTSTSTT